MKDNSLLNTLMQIAQLSKSIEIDLDQNGNLRSLTTTSKGGLQHLCARPAEWLSANKITPEALDGLKAQVLETRVLEAKISEAGVSEARVPEARKARVLKGKAIDEIDAFYIAHEFINLPAIKTYLQSANIELEIDEITPFAFGYRISCKQMASCADKQMVNRLDKQMADCLDEQVADHLDKQIAHSPDQQMLLPVYGGALHITINRQGEIFSLTSTLQYGQAKIAPKVVISKMEAVSLASANCKHPVACAEANLMLVTYDDKLEAAYKITLLCRQPKRSYACVVSAETGKIIERRSITLNRHRSTISALVKARALLRTPHPDQPISQQASDVIIKHLPNPQVLRNAYLDMFTGQDMNMVYAMADGSYCYKPEEPEFAAVSVFLSLANQIELYVQSGMTPPDQSLVVVVDDPDVNVNNNAYFEPLHYEIHLGIGTGVEHGGLTRHIAYDLGVANHEFGHAMVYWQSAAHELAGAQGVAINEAMGDVLGTLVMDYLSQIWYAEQFGRKLTKRDLQNDARVIGTYALPPFGIRTQKNSRSTPADLSGEPHGDGLIIGGALADLLIAMATKPGRSIENQIRLFTKLNLMALALLPGHKVLFSDMLRALITSDQQLCAGQYRSVIEQCFKKHGIAIDTIASR